MARRTATGTTAQQKQSLTNFALWIRAVLPCAIFILTVIVYSPALRYGFVDWDDDIVILHNPNVCGISPAHLRWMFTTTYVGHYQPLTWLSLALNYEAGKLNPFGYHLVNILLHAGNATFVFWLSLKVFNRAMARISSFSRILLAVVAAMLFAIHPLRAESVAWVTERRDVLSTFFLLAGVLAYMFYADHLKGRTRRVWYGASLILIFLSLLSKAWGMTIPAVLLVLDWYPLRRVDVSNWRHELGSLLLEKIPFIILGGGAAGMALSAQLAEVGNFMPRSTTYRIMQSFHGLTFYLFRIFVPLNLSPIYEHPHVMDMYSPRFIAPVLIVITISIVTFALRRRIPALFASWLLYVIIVAPVLGIVQAGPQFAADRYSYVACIPIVMLVAGGIALLWARNNSYWAIRYGMAALGAVAFVLLAMGTRRQVGIWRDTDSLWQSALSHDANSTTALLGLGMLNIQRNHYAEAIPLLHRAHESSPGFAQVSVCLGVAYASIGKSQQSLTWLRKATTQPSVTDSDLLLIGTGLSTLGQYVEAQDVLRRIISHNAADAEAHFRLANALEHAAESDQAILEYQRTVELEEPVVESGLNDPKVDMEAYYYQQSCLRLLQLLDERKDTIGTAKYAEKMLKMAPGRTITTVMPRS